MMLIWTEFNPSSVVTMNVKRQDDSLVWYLINKKLEIVNKKKHTIYDAT
jgi:hypothetical protein